jgi:hypothetical protein
MHLAYLDRIGCIKVVRFLEHLLTEPRQLGSQVQLNEDTMKIRDTKEISYCIQRLQATAISNCVLSA